MEWHDEIRESLPKRRGDEPASLRRDIEDELADHLHCAMQRERVTAQDDETARRAVLARFGNPRRVAYKLWWDAMKEKIMKDRLMMGALAILTLASLAALGLSWTALERSQRANAAIVEKLDTLAAQVEKSTIPPNQSILKVRVVEAGNPNKPLTGVVVGVRGINSQETGDYRQFRTTDPAGQIKLNLRPGSYQVYFVGLADSSTSLAMGGYDIKKELKLFGGELTEETLPVPASELVHAPGRVRVAVDWPRELDVLNRQERAPGEYFIGCTIDRPQLRLVGADASSRPIRFVINTRGDILVGKDIPWPDPDNIGPPHFGSIQEFFNYRQHLNGTDGYYSPRPARNQTGNPQAIQQARELILYPGEYEVLMLGVQRAWPAAEKDNGAQAQAWHEYYPENAPLVRFTVPAQGVGELRLPIPDSMRKRLTAVLQPEAVFEAKKENGGNTDWHYFHDVQFSIDFSSYRPNPPARTTMMLSLHVTRLSGKPAARVFERLAAGQTVTFGDTQFTIERISSTPGTFWGSARIRAKYLAQPASATPVTSSTQPTTHTLHP